MARRLKAVAVPRVVAVVNLLLQRLGEDADLREHGRVVVLGALDRLDARWWLEHRPVPVVRLAELLWRHCRPQALYRRAYASARAWRAGLVEGDNVAIPSDEGGAFEHARRLGYAVVGPGPTPLDREYEKVCRERKLPLVVADLTGRYPWASGVVTSAEHALVSASLVDCRRIFSDDERAELEASCAVSVPTDDPTSRVSADSRVVTAIVPIELAVPLAARLSTLFAGFGPPDNPQPERHPANGPAARPMGHPD